MLDKVRAVLALALYGLTLAVFFVGAFAVFMMSSFGWFAWNFDFKVTELILLPLALALLALGYAVDPGIARSQKKQSAPATASQERE